MAIETIAQLTQLLEVNKFELLETRHIIDNLVMKTDMYNTDSHLNDVRYEQDLRNLANLKRKEYALKQNEKRLHSLVSETLKQEKAVRHQELLATHISKPKLSNEAQNHLKLLKEEYAERLVRNRDTHSASKNSEFFKLAGTIAKGINTGNITDVQQVLEIINAQFRELDDERNVIEDELHKEIFGYVRTKGDKIGKYFMKQGE